MQVRDEFPLIVFSATYALERVVDELVIIDDGSQDHTSEFLGALAREYPGRVKAISRDASAFSQAATLQDAVMSVRPDKGSWIVPIDADEFIISTEVGEIPRTLLHGQAGHRKVLELPVTHWICPEDFSEYEPNDYLRIQGRSSPRYSGYANLYSAGLEMAEGWVNFFDIPTMPKVVFRSGYGLKATAGSHAVVGNRGAKGPEGSRGHSLQIAHLPFTGIDRARNRIGQSLRLIARGAHPHVGWQSHVVALVFREHEEGQFWRNHSLSSSTPRSLYAVSSLLSERLAPVVSDKQDFLKECLSL